jgi:hypothetical protein
MTVADWADQIPLNKRARTGAANWGDAPLRKLLLAGALRVAAPSSNEQPQWLSWSRRDPELSQSAGE